MGEPTSADLRVVASVLRVRQRGVADLTILEKDPYKVDPDALMNIKVSETWVGGQKRYG